ncbi:MAG: LysE family transporter, partial [Pseudomonadota bacterium]|nr:LysE family transporter [Pseudomonadota bacterium]
AWIFEVLRYAGAAYLGFLALKSLRAAWRGGVVAVTPSRTGSRLFAKGLALHLTNPKAIFSWGAVYAVALPAGADMAAVWSLFGALIAVSMLVFFGYALLFSTAAIAAGYARAKRGFDLVFGLMFGAAAAKIFTTRVEAP